ncbi:ABC transporter substrate-binding protein [Natronococcus jeotgali]|uniref:Ferrichrome-binding protein n=1 Tax=Natronococcus jeotgali DSM 18795 TaxID=1227498 RepID=L9XRF7_9EURY|nr:ABC transporter substrate-binding protein [Natronococcus jeotgali]ELY64107.1 ferrichrome-binding protein [Natronococcus jeotgali DSM 18795]
MTDAQQWTRRTVVRAGGAVAAGTALAGCISGGDGGSDGSGDGESYSVSMPPVGEVEFEGVPETWVANNGSWADMGVALGRDPPEALWMPSRYHTRYYDEIPDVSVDGDSIDALYEDGDGVDKEKFYDHDADVHAIDPNFLQNRYDGWEESDIEDVAGVGPFFGNSIFSREYDWHDYEYLTLYEAFEKVSQVFREEERYEAFAELHDEFQSTLEDVVPPEEERPAVAVLWPNGDGTFLPYVINEGTSFKQWRDLGVRDALAESDVEDFHSSRGQIDYETLLEVDPDVILCRGNEDASAEEFQESVVANMEADAAGSELTAVQNGDVYRGGPLYQGPITNLVVTQRAAEQVYGVDEQLFDPQAVSDIVNGDA